MAPNGSSSGPGLTPEAAQEVNWASYRQYPALDALERAAKALDRVKTVFIGLAKSIVEAQQQSAQAISATNELRIFASNKDANEQQLYARINALEMTLARLRAVAEADVGKARRRTAAKKHKRRRKA